MKSTTASKTVEKLRTVFAAFGLPEQIVTDNGPQFVSDEFAVFLRSNAVQHVKTPPYHPASNGAAERLVQTVKNLVRQLRDERRSGQARTIQHRLDQLLLTYRNTPCSTTVRITGAPLAQPGPATPEETEETPTEVQEPTSEATDSTAVEQPPEPLPRRSTRVRRQPER
ncbi:uncharacterized protein K02A2.6-like [Dermacentor silvarum]|uniref:uncharacterized protein K02A2.6-like n=1 Tax=Dermacentor silvarum TaxID=543639 RepID=UPI00210180F8|nr:uncharacterized protein K02A2.6-like [Dermacentor silvarum]